MKISKYSVLALAAMVTLAACARDAEDETVPADTTAAANTTGAPQDGPPMDPQVTGLDDVNDSGIEGEATATHSAQEATVSILLKGDKAKADVTYPAHIHSGTCDAPGPVVVELEPVKNMQSSKTIQVSQLPQGQPLLIQVHDAGGKPVACGNMKGHDEGTVRDTAAHTTTTAH
jgi:hypothetical protein